MHALSFECCCHNTAAMTTVIASLAFATLFVKEMDDAGADMDMCTVCGVNHGVRLARVDFLE